MMNRSRRTVLGAVILLAGAWPVTAATLTLNPAMPIDRQVSVRLIQTAADDGSNAAPLLGDAGQQSAIFDYIDQIWSQAGIDIAFDVQPTTYDDTFALLGNPGDNDPRPVDDLTTMYFNALADGVLDPDPNVLNMFAVRIVPGSFQRLDDQLNGVAFFGGIGVPGISAVWIGPDLLDSDDGRVGIAELLAHEIGHNLGLEHSFDNTHLMWPTRLIGSPRVLLSSSEVDTARASAFAVVIPEPASTVLVGLALWGLCRMVRRRR